MVTDTERREVARRLRNLKLEDPTHGYITWGQIALTINPGGGTFSELPDLLADLIEPPTHCPHYHSGRHYCSVHEDMALIDRDALLELADDVDGAADDSGGFEPLAGMLRDIAHRIREALGAADG